MLNNKIVHCEHCSQPNSVFDSECCYCGFPLDNAKEVLENGWN